MTICSGGCWSRIWNPQKRRSRKSRACWRRSRTLGITWTFRGGRRAHWCTRVSGGKKALTRLLPSLTFPSYEFSEGCTESASKRTCHPSAPIEKRNPENNSESWQGAGSWNLMWGAADLFGWDQVELDDAAADFGSIHLVGPGRNGGLDGFEAAGLHARGGLREHGKLHMIRARGSGLVRRGFGLRRGRLPDTGVFLSRLNPHTIAFPSLSSHRLTNSSAN